MIILFTTLCIANLVIHYQEVSADPDNEDKSFISVTGKVLSKYWASFVGAFIAIIFSIFVFGLCGYHSFLVSTALTTQEHLKGVYAKFSMSPFSHGRAWANWKKTVLWPNVS